MAYRTTEFKNRTFKNNIGIDNLYYSQSTFYNTFSCRFDTKSTDFPYYVTKIYLLKGFLYDFKCYLFTGCVILLILMF